MKRTTITGILIALVLVIGVVLVWLSGGTTKAVDTVASVLPGVSTSAEKAQKVEEAKQVEKAKERLYQSLSLIPADSYTVSHASMSARDGAAKWWTNYYNFLPRANGLPEELPENLGVESLTYAGFPNWEMHGDGVPFAWAVVLGTSAEKRDTLVEYLNQHNTEGLLFVHTAYIDEDAYVVVAPVTSFNTIDALVRSGGAAGNPEAFDSVTSLDEFRVDNEDPAIYYNFNRWLETLFKYVPEDASLQQEYLDKIRNKWFGFSGEAEFVGVSKDQGATWQGRFINGGINIHSINLQEFADASYEQELWWNGSEPDDPLQWGYYSEGLSSVQEAASVTVQEETFGGVVNPHKVADDPLRAPAVKGKASILISPQMMQNTLMSSVEPYGIKTIWLVADDSGKTDLTFDFYEDDDFTN